jgi:hypothetical protein
MSYLLLLAIFSIIYILFRTRKITKLQYGNYTWMLVMVGILIIFGFKIFLIIFLLIMLIYVISNNQKIYNINQTAPSSDYMSYNEALRILNLHGKPKVAEIKKAYKDQMNKFHPDKGGNEYFATKINKAKEILLEGTEDN